MPDAPATAPDVEEAFQRALERDAAVAPPGMPAPPRLAVSADPEAPHGRAEDGSPLAPYGTTKEGRPRIKPAGRGHKADEPRVTGAAAAAPAAAAAAAGGPDYREDLAGLAMTIWMGGAMLPPTRPYAQLFKQSTPGMVNAWNIAAQKNPAVRGYVEKLAGKGSWAWVIGVVVTTGPFLAGCLALSKSTPEAKEARAKLAAVCEAEFKEFMDQQMTAIAELQAEAEMAGGGGMSRLDEVREQLPGAVKTVTQFVVDNPGQTAIVAAFTIVAARGARNVIRPSTPVQAAALAVVLAVGLSWTARKAIATGALQFRLRGADGQLVTLHGPPG